MRLRGLIALGPGVALRLGLGARFFPPGVRDILLLEFGFQRVSNSLAGCLICRACLIARKDIHVIGLAMAGARQVGV